MEEQGLGGVVINPAKCLIDGAYGMGSTVPQPTKDAPWYDPQAMSWAGHVVVLSVHAVALTCVVAACVAPLVVMGFIVATGGKGR